MGTLRKTTTTTTTTTRSKSNASKDCGRHLIRIIVHLPPKVTVSFRDPTPTSRTKPLIGSVFGVRACVPACFLVRLSRLSV